MGHKNIFKPSDEFFQTTFKKYFDKLTHPDNTYNICFGLKKSGKYKITTTPTRCESSTYQFFNIPSIRAIIGPANIPKPHIYILSNLNPFKFDPIVYKNINKIKTDFTLYLIPNISNIISKKVYSIKDLTMYMTTQYNAINKESVKKEHVYNIDIQEDILHVSMNSYNTQKPSNKSKKTVPSIKPRYPFELNDIISITRLNYNDYEIIYNISSNYISTHIISRNDATNLKNLLRQYNIIVHTNNRD